MSRKFLIAALIGCVFQSMWCDSVHAESTKPFVIPELKQWKGGEGQFVPTSTMKIVVDASAAEFKKAAESLAADYKMMFGVEPQVVSGKPAAGDIIFKKGDKKEAVESYILHIGSQIVISSPTEKGAYWATRTLLQMFDAGGEKHAVDCGVAVDNPDFRLRGFMLDVARKFVPMSYLYSLVKTMAYYKMNTFQIHLNDCGSNEYRNMDWNKTYSAFRLECDTYPGLTSRDGYYTKKEFIEFQKMAAEYGVEVIPEIDAPAHSLAFTQYDPTLGSEEFGMDHLNLRNPKVKPFLENLWKEYISGDNPVFQGKRVDIGTDEYSNKNQEVTEKFRELMDGLIRYVESYGKQAVCWGSLTHSKGKTPVKSENVVMSLWYNGYAQPQEMKEAGYKEFISVPDGLIYIVPRAGYYNDYLNIRYLYNNWTPNIVAQVTFDYDDPTLLGGMFALWNDIIGNGVSTKDLHDRIFPALQTLSAKFWTGKNVSVPFDDFNFWRRTVREAPGVNESGKLADTPSLVLQMDELKPNTRHATPFTEAGYGYTVSFDIEGVKEAKGTVLFESPNATFYLAEPASGNFGYTRDGYLYAFNYKLYPGEKARITICGSNEETTLFVNGVMKERKNGYTIYCDKQGKFKMNISETLMFPLQKTGEFKSRIRNFRLYNFMDMSLFK